MRTIFKSFFVATGVDTRLLYTFVGLILAAPEPPAANSSCPSASARAKQSPAGEKDRVLTRTADLKSGSDCGDRIRGETRSSGSSKNSDSGSLGRTLSTFFRIDFFLANTWLQDPTAELADIALEVVVVIEYGGDVGEAIGTEVVGENARSYCGDVMVEMTGWTGAA